jgi:hypothetical protein
MNIIISVLSANVLIGIISGITTTINGIYTINDVIKNNTATGAKEVEQIMKELDIEVKLKIIQLFLNELKITDETSYTIKYCIYEIKKIITSIETEIKTIHERLKYNNSLWFGVTIRSYKFHNCKIRIESHLKNLEQRYHLLVSLLTVSSKIIKNDNVKNDMTDSFLNN